MDLVFLLGRILFALIFLGSVTTHFSKQSIEYAKMYKTPWPQVTVPATGVLVGLGGLLVAVGAWADLGMLLIVAFLVPASLLMHAFWRETDPQMKKMQMIQFMKNLGLIGGALILFYAYNQLQSDAGFSLTDPLFSRWS